jgi:uncharacterized protein (TIGR02594 family)
MQPFLAALAIAGAIGAAVQSLMPYREPEPLLPSRPVVYALAPDTVPRIPDPMLSSGARWQPPPGTVLPRPMPPRRPVAAIKAKALLARAEAHIGDNPTGWSRLWCARFMAMLVPQAERFLKRKGLNPNWAKDWAALPKVKPRPGAIAVLTRKGGGHIGVVKKVKRNGTVLVVSGNARGKPGRRVVAEGWYPRSRVIAYVSAAL